jgi:hypothetical protein
MDDREGQFIDTAAPFGPLDGYDSTRAEAAYAEHGFEPDAPPRNELEASRAKGWATRTILAATLLLAVLNAHALQTWATTLPPDWGGETVRVLADAWAGRTAEAGLDRPRAAIHDAYEAKKTLTWSDLKSR